MWVTTSEGNIFLLNGNLEDVANFPIMISGIPSGDSSSFDEGLIIPLEKKLCYVYLDGKEKIIDLPLTGSIKSNPTVLNKNVAIYDKSFAGKIFVLENDVCINQENPFMISGRMLDNVFLMFWYAVCGFIASLNGTELGVMA